MNVFTNFLSITDLYSVQTFFENHQLYLGIRKEKTEVSTVNDNISSNYFNMELFLTKWCIDTEFRHISVMVCTSTMHPMPCMVNPYSLQTVFNGVMHNPLGLFCSTSLHLSVFHILLNSNERQRQHKSLRNFCYVSLCKQCFGMHDAPAGIGTIGRESVPSNTNACQQCN